MCCTLKISAFFTAENEWGKTVIASLLPKCKITYTVKFLNIEKEKKTKPKNLLISPPFLSSFFQKAEVA